MLSPTVRNFITYEDALAEVCAANERAIEAMPSQSWLYGIGINQNVLKTDAGEVLRFSAETEDGWREFRAAKKRHGIA